MRGEFMAFLKQYGIIGLAIAVIIEGGRQRAQIRLPTEYPAITRGS